MDINQREQRMFNFLKKKIYNLHTFESLNEDMKRKEYFYYDVENKCVRVKIRVNGTDIFEELNELTFKSVDADKPDYTTGEFIVGRPMSDIRWVNITGTAIIDNKLTDYGKACALDIINDITEKAEATIKHCVEIYRKNKDFVYNPTLATQHGENNYVFGNCIKLNEIKDYFTFLDKCPLKYMDEYKNYVLKQFKLKEGAKYEYDMIRVVEPYMNWLEINQERLDDKALRNAENKKCEEIFEMIKKA
jgi:hypothetical protein